MVAGWSIPECCLPITTLRKRKRQRCLRNGGFLMTDSRAATTIPEGTGYHAFWGPRPVAWDQRSLMQTGNAREHQIQLLNYDIRLLMYSSINTSTHYCTCA